MKVLIEIPKEFEEHFNNDQFKDSLERVCTDIDGSSNFLVGLYESEVIKMLKDSLIKAEVVKDTDKLTKAKEIIKDQKELLDRVLSDAEILSDFAQNTLRKAENFLKESEVKK